MLYSDVIIVGGGPAGSTCAWKLKQQGVDSLILDKQKFPRLKVCAGWITPEVIENLKIKVTDYPYSLISFDKIHYHFWGKQLKIRTVQYSIRRYEFDHWLLKRAGVPVHQHPVKQIRFDAGHYTIDNLYRCQYLVGAAGTHCPVYRTFFRDENPRQSKYLVTAMEDEFRYDYENDHCYLWFFENQLPGYAWYVPKGNGYLNIGIGGYLTKLKKRNTTLWEQWNYFTRQLESRALVKGHRWAPQGYTYYVRHPVRKVQIGQTYVVGDSAGIATKDLAEGIGPAVASAILAANSIISGKPYSLKSISKYSIF